MTPGELKAHLLVLEVSLHRPEVRRSRAALERLLAPEFSEFGRSGRIYDRSTIIDALVQEDLAPPTAPPDVSDVGCLLLATNCALLTYLTSRVGAEGRIVTLRSSVWKFVDGAWCMVFHQGTPASTTVP